MNHLGKDVSLGECFTRYFKKRKINGIERNYLRDTGADIDLCERSYIDSEDLTGKVTWIKQPPDNECKCLSLARVTIKGDFGTVITKATAKPIDVEQGYLSTPDVNEKSRGNPVPMSPVITRNQRCESKRKMYTEQVASKLGSENRIR